MSIDRDTQRRLEQRRKAQRHAKRTWRDNPERAQMLYGINASRQPPGDNLAPDLFSTPTPRNSRNSEQET